LLNTLTGRVHVAAALLELLPSWLRFLEARGLLDAEQREATLREIVDLPESLGEYWADDPTDPAPAQALARWRETAGLTEDV
jgi:hypothetical protein